MIDLEKIKEDGELANRVLELEETLSSLEKEEKSYGPNNGWMSTIFATHVTCLPDLKIHFHSNSRRMTLYRLTKEELRSQIKELRNRLNQRR